MTRCRLMKARTIVTFVAILVTLGCDNDPSMAPVSGTVTYQGKAVPEGAVTFYPKTGGRPSIGQIQPDGSYKLSSVAPGDGAVVGEYTVVIEARRIKSSVPPRKSFEEELALEGKSQPAASAKIEWLVPEKYSSSETSGLAATVDDKNNVIDFEL